MSITVETPTAPIAPAAVEHAKAEVAKRRERIAGKAQPKAKEPLLLAPAIAATRAILAEEAFQRQSVKELNAGRLQKMRDIVRPFETLKGVTTIEVNKVKEGISKLFLADIEQRQPDKAKAAKNAATQAGYVMNAMQAAAQGFTLKVAEAEPHNCRNWTDYHKAALQYLKDGENGAKIVAPTKQRKGAQTREENKANNKTPKLDKVTVTELDAAKVPAEERKTFLEQCANLPRLASSILYLTDNDMPKARMWAVALLDHAEEVDEAIKSIVAPKATTSKRFK